MKCAVSWCSALPTPNTLVCRLHLKYPLKHSWENKHEWSIRVARELRKADKAAQKAAASDKKIAERGR